MTTKEDESWRLSICGICKQPVGTEHALRVQKIEDDEGNPIENAPIVWFHKACLRPQ